MPDVNDLFSEFIARQLAGERPDPFQYMDKLSEDEREELGDLIDAFLERAPREAWDADAFRGSDAERIVERVDRAVNGASGMWPALLPRLRHRAKIRREDLVARLAEALGKPEQRSKVGAYYHEMEQGILPSEGVNEKVLEALGSIVDVSAAALRDAGERLLPAQGGQATQRSSESPAFARKTVPDPDYIPEAPTATRGASDGEPDEIDKLFRDG
jgi:hypothetical protein